MNSKLNHQERAYLLMVKNLPCGVCGASPPSDAHHIEQGLHYLCIPLCKDCHTGYNGIHGTKAFWRIKKLSEHDVLNQTIRKLCDDK
jgi:hypothetical protein